MTTMEEIHDRIKAAVARSVEKGVAEREAFGRHMMALATDYPAIFAAYASWLADGRP